MSEFGICPLTWNQCCGPDKCAPARFSQQHARVEEDEELQPVCPISDLTLSARIVSTALLPLALGPGYAPEDEEQSAEENDKTLAEDVKDKLKLDQV